MSLDMLLVRNGQRLAAADPVSLEALESIRDNETVTATIRRARNPRHHAKFFALLAAIFPHQDQFATTLDLLNALKIATGYFNTSSTIDGIPYMTPKSVSFAAMTQSSFEEFYDRCVDIILARIVPGINRDELTDRVNDIINGNQH